MINTQHYDAYFPEPGVTYFINEKSKLIVWEGFFDQLFVHIRHDTKNDECPIEFTDYNNSEGWKNGHDKSRQINPFRTIESLKKVIDKERRQDYLNCYISILNYLAIHSSQEIFIGEYL